MVRRVVLFLAVVVVAFSAFRAVQAAAASAVFANLDIDSNGKADFVVFRANDLSGAGWYILQNPGAASAFKVTSISGTAARETLLPPLDYNNDGKADLGTYQTLNISTSSPAGTWTFQVGPTFTSAFKVSWGAAGDIPIPADWDGDGVMDLAYYRPSEQSLSILQGGTTPAFSTAFLIRYGRRGDIPVPGDFDGDGRIDFGLWRPTEQVLYVLQGGTSFKTAFTLPSSSIAPAGAPVVPLAGDFDGDGRLDFAVYTTTNVGPADPVGTWRIAQGGNSFKTQFSTVWGATGDTPVPGDFDGDGRLDIAVWRPPAAIGGVGTLFVLQGGTSYTTGFSVGWGTTNDTPFGARNPVVNTIF